MTDFASLPATRAAYDAVATVYAGMFSDSLRESPLERGLLSVFAELAGSGGEVADLGCGPGYVTSHLHGLGLRAFGIDASPAMIALAREAHPALRFHVGSMAALALADGSLDGVLSRWSLIHTPPAEVPAVLDEFARVLAPGGYLLLSLAATEGPEHETQPYDHAVTTAYRWSPDRLTALLAERSLIRTALAVAEPEPADKRRFRTVHLFARKA
jgi:SAM-dependent methyltransferase